MIDGPKALRSVTEEFLGAQASVARCYQHIAKNVIDNVPKEYHAVYESARCAQSSQVTELGRIDIQTAASLHEGFEETLTIHRLGVSPFLPAHPTITNII
jgi:putative transposase